MAKPSATAAPAPAPVARVLIGAFANVVFLLLLAFFLSPRAVTPQAVVSKEGRNGVAGLTGHHGVRRVDGYSERCGYLAGVGLDRAGHDRRGYVDYLYLFYCVCGEERRVLGYGMMAAWLAVLFYLLGDTAAVYFCSSLEGLSRLLRLSPAIAGVTLLSLGNGAPDALSTVASFASVDGDGKGGTVALGLNGVLGGAMLVSTAVLGVIGLRLGARGVAVDGVSFYRDASFLFLALAAVAVVIAAGEVTIWGAIAFTSLYLVYILAVAFTQRRTRRGDEADHAAAASSELCDVAETKFYDNQEPLLPDTAPLLSHYAGDAAGSGGNEATTNVKSAFWSALRVLELPLWLPRRLTIPDASKERWSKPAAVTAATLAPGFLTYLCSHASGSASPLAALLVGLTGAPLGLLAFNSTSSDAPPTRFLSAWLAGGFVMSVAWAYAVANELLSLLVSAAHVLGVDSSALGLTVLAWGNSLGDLVANVAVAARGGDAGAQVAVSGCYGGPVFGVLVGLGLALLLSCWAGYPRPVEIPREPRLFLTLGFVVAGLLWAVVLLTRRRMKVDRTLGFGLVSIYLCFLCINIVQTLGPTLY